MIINQGHRLKTFYRGLFMATSLIALSAAANAQTVPPAAADAPSTQAGNTVEEIVITGTQIRGVAPVGAPVISLGQEEIISSGANNTSDVLHDIPQVSSLGAGQNTLGGNQAANLNTNRANAINIRGIGTQATLTLLDGRRVPPGGSSSQLYDPDSIPTIAIRNIDVVADGASATYGSDAVAGVANIVLRKNFEGAEVETRYGTADSYNTKKIDAIFGHKWDSGSFMVAGEINTNNELSEGKRIQYFACNEAAFGFGNACSKSGAPGNVTVPAGASIPAGSYGLPVGAGVGTTAAQLGAVNYFNPALDSSLIPRDDRKSIVANVQQDLTDSINVWAEGYFTDNHIRSNTGQFLESVTLPNTNPGFVPLGAGITKETISFGLDPYSGPIHREGYEHGYETAVGGNIDIGGDWKAAAYYEHMGNDFHGISSSINTATLNASLACTTPGLCFNPFGSVTPSNISAFNNFIGSTVNDDLFRSDLVNAKVDGTVIALPGGDAKLAIGMEFHRDSLSEYTINNVSGPNLQTPFIPINTEAARTVASVYAEGIIPIVGEGNEMPFIKRLDIDLAGRYDKYSDVGSTINPKYAIRWKPIDDLSLHASYGTSFRAPTLCDINPGCTAAVLTFPAYGGSPPYNVLTVVGGNTNVKPETARTDSLGADYKPSWFKGSSFSINYFNINYVNVIGTPAATNPAVITQPAIYSSFVTLNPTAAQIAKVTSLPYYTGATFPTTPGSVFAIVDGTRHNAGAIHTSGVDLAADYTWSDGWGDWTVGGTATAIFEFKEQVVVGTPYTDYINQANFPVSFRGRAKFAWSNEDFGVTTYVNYTGPYNVVQLLSTTQNQPVSSYATVDANFVYKLNTPSWGGGYADGVTVSLSIQNLTDAKPPLAVVASTYQFDSQNASALGRLVTFGIRKSF